MPEKGYKMFKDFHKSIKSYEAATKEKMNDSARSVVLMGFKFDPIYTVYHF